MKLNFAKDHTFKETESADKAWSFFKQILDDEEKYTKFKDNNKPIQVTGDLGGEYFLYPNGSIVRIDDNSPMVGNVYFNDQIHRVDFLSTVLLWIKHNEQKLRQVWGCGGLSVIYNGTKNVGNPIGHLNQRPMRVERVGSTGTLQDVFPFNSNMVMGTYLLCGTVSTAIPFPAYSIGVMGT